MVVTPKSVIDSEFEAQEAYAKEVAESRFNYSVVVAGAFVRGMRDVGYKSAASAINELNDNAYQAGASKIAIWMDTAKGQVVEGIAVIDDGHGMVPEMIRLAMLWGGTHRENSRTLFGRFGFGLPSSSVSIGQRFTVLSKTAGGSWHGCSFDLTRVEEGDYRDTDGHIVMPEPVPMDVPGWVVDGIKHRANFGKADLNHGTIVVIDKIDKLKPKTVTPVASSFKQTFGLTYRKLCTQRPITVQGERVVPVDPLFLTPGAWAYDYDGQRAVELEPKTITLDNKETGQLGDIEVRFSQMPYTFLRLDPDRPKERGQGRNNPRFQVRDQNNGIIVLRAGRQLDVVTTSRGQDADIRSKFFVNNDDRTWGVQIDFSPVLDEDFAVTTSKQGVKMSPRIWKALEDNGVFAHVREMRRQYDIEKAKFRVAQEEEQEKKRASEEAMEEEAKHQRQDKTDPKKEERKKEGFEREAKRRAKESGLPPEAVKPALEAETEERPWAVSEEDLPAGSTFYRLDQVGGQKKLWINRGHRFYSQVYAGPDSTELTRAQWEVFLFILGDCEVSGTDDLLDFYSSERIEWSRRLNLTLRSLERTMPPAQPVDPEDISVASAEVA